MGRKKLPNPKGTGYKRPCASCKVLCYGTNCRACSYIVKPIEARIQRPQRAQAIASEPAWWVTSTREEFMANYAKELNRLLAVKVSSVASLTTVWD